MMNPAVSNKKQGRISFASIKNKLEYPDFLDIQLKSFKDFPYKSFKHRRKLLNSLKYNTYYILNYITIY